MGGSLLEVDLDAGLAKLVEDGLRGVLGIQYLSIDLNIHEFSQYSCDPLASGLVL